MSEARMDITAKVSRVGCRVRRRWVVVKARWAMMTMVTRGSYRRMTGALWWWRPAGRKAGRDLDPDLDLDMQAL